MRFIVESGGMFDLATDSTQAQLLSATAGNAIFVVLSLFALITFATSNRIGKVTQSLKK
jgi:hypothetical protein